MASLLSTALEAAAAIVLEEPSLTSPCQKALRRLANALGTPMPTQATFRALLAVLDQRTHPGKFALDKDAWGAHGVSRKSFSAWRRKLNQASLSD